MSEAGWVDGNGELGGLMIVNEFPPAECVKKRRILPWKMEREMEQLLDKFGWDGPIWVTNFFKYTLNDKKQHTEDEWDMMSSLMEEEVKRIDPTVIMPIGPLPTRFFTGARYDINTMNGVVHQWNGIKVVPSISILSALYSTDLYSMVMEALEKINDDDMEEMWTPPSSLEWKKTGIDTVLSHYTDGIAIDTETLEDGSTYMIQVATQPEEVCIMYVDGTEDYNINRLRQFVKKPNVWTVMHNAMFDLDKLKQVNIEPSHVHDTMILAFLLQTYPLGLKDLAYHINKWEMDEYLTVVGDLPDLSYVEKGKREKYAGDDPIATIRAYSHLKWRSKKEGYGSIWDVEQRDVKIMPMLMSMMERGIKADRGRFAKLESELWLKTMILTEEMREMLGNPMFPTGKKGVMTEFNPGSDKQVAEILYGKLGLGKGKDIKKNKWGGSVDKNQLKKIEDEHPVIKLLQEYSEVDTIIDSFATALPEKIKEDGRIHTSLQLVRVKHSGRISSSKPNLMAIPVRTEDGRRIRQCFVAEDGYVLVGNDYSQVEMRLMAHLSQDARMMKAYIEGKDIHSETAMAMFGLSDVSMVDELQHRYPAKRTGFGIINNISAGGLMRELLDGGAGAWEEWECEELLNKWFSVYPGVKNFMLQTQAEARRFKKVYDMWGRMEYIPQVNSSQEYLREKGLRIAMNQKIQSGAQGIIKEAMVNLGKVWPEWKEKKWAYPLMQIHDDLLWEIKEDRVDEIVPVIREIMETPVKLSIPLAVDTKIGKNWMEMKKWKKVA